MMDEEDSAEVSADALARFATLAERPLKTVTTNTGFFSGAARSIADIWAHRHLWWLLTKRELKARYKDSVLGYVWTLIRPLVNLMIYYLAIGKVLGAERAIPDFAIYVFAGLTVWTLFNTTLASSTASVLANAGIVKKVYLPREVFPLAATGSAFIDFLSQLAILFVGALVIRGLAIEPLLMYGPLSVLVMLVWAIAFGVILSAVNVYLRDIQYLVEVGLIIGFWMTPSVYSFQMITESAPPIVADLYLLNPTAVAVIGMQKAFWISGADAVWPSHLLTRLMIALVVGLILVFVAQRAFDKLQQNFAQEL